MNCCSDLACTTLKTLQPFATHCFCNHDDCANLQKTLEFFKHVVNKSHSIVYDFAEYYAIEVNQSDFNQCVRAVASRSSIPEDSKIALQTLIQLRNLVEHFSSIKSHITQSNSPLIAIVNQQPHLCKTWFV